MQTHAAAPWCTR